MLDEMTMLTRRLAILRTAIVAARTELARIESAHHVGAQVTIVDDILRLAEARDMEVGTNEQR